MVTVSGRASLRKTCSHLNKTIGNPIYYQQKITEWKEKIIHILGLSMLEVLSPKHYSSYEIPFYLKNNWNQKFQIYFDQENLMGIKIIIFPGMMNMFKEFLGKYPINNSVTGNCVFQDYYILYGELNSLAKFIYSFYLFTVCKWQHKIIDKVLSQQISETISCMHTSKFFYQELLIGFNNSNYLSLPSTPNFSQLYFLNHINSLVSDFKKDLFHHKLHFADVAKLISFYY